MADDVTLFSLELTPEGWFAPELKGDGWFDRSLHDEPAAGGAINGTVSATLGAATLTATATLTISGALSGTLGTLTGTSSGDVDIAAGLAGQLSPLTLTGTAKLEIKGQVNATLGALTVAALGELVFPAITGVLNSTLGELTSAAIGSAQDVKPEVSWPGAQNTERERLKERQRAALVADLIRQARERGKAWVEANKPQVRRNIRRHVERELRAEGLLSDAIMGKVVPMVADAVESVPLLDFEALGEQLAQYDRIIWQQAERLAEEYRLAFMADEEDALIVMLAAA